ncbi:MAG: potassium channel family protein [Acidimicrobiales bacterium]
MKVSIAGGGVVGRSIARDLSRNGHEVLIVEVDDAVVSRQAGQTGWRWVPGDACEVSVLSQAEFDSADVVVACTGDDEDNLVVSLLSKQEFAVPRVIARVNHPKNIWLFNETWGVDVAVSTPHLMTALVEEALSVGTLVPLMSLADGRAGLVEVTLDATSPAVERAIADLGMPRDSSVVAVVRSRRVVVPRGDIVLAAGDEVIVLVAEGAEDAVKSILTS